MSIPFEHIPKSEALILSFIDIELRSTGKVVVTEAPEELETPTNPFAKSLDLPIEEVN